MLIHLRAEGETADRIKELALLEERSVSKMAELLIKEALNERNRDHPPKALGQNNRVVAPMRTSVRKSSDVGTSGAAGDSVSSVDVSSVPGVSGDANGVRTHAHARAKCTAHGLAKCGRLTTCRVETEA